MKKKFAEYYNLSQNDYNDIWKDALIVFDTNILLNLYKCTDDTRAEFISVMKFYESRLWLPYQVALEFNRNRISIICGNSQAYSQLSKKLEEEIQKAIKTVEGWEKALYKTHPYISLNEIKSNFTRTISTVKKKLVKLETEHPDLLECDSIFNDITNIYDGKVGENYNEEQLEKIYQEGKRRYEQKIPPGYCDENDKKNRSKQEIFGDLIIWKQILDKSKSESKNIIFVSNDEKEDWKLEYNGKTIGARKELIKEFFDVTGKKILIYNSQCFLEYAKSNKSPKISQKTIENIKRIAEDSKQQMQRINEIIQNINESCKPLKLDFMSGVHSESFENFRRLQEQLNMSLYGIIPSKDKILPEINHEEL